MRLLRIPQPLDHSQITDRGELFEVSDGLLASPERRRNSPRQPV